MTSSLENYFKDYWCADTSYAPNLWTPENPALGQCVPTCLIIQDILGGEIDRGTVHLKDGGTETHYWNVINGQVVDATISQYHKRLKHIAPKRLPDAIRLRDHALQNPDTHRRYELLKKKLGFVDRQAFVYLVGL